MKKKTMLLSSISLIAMLIQPLNASEITSSSETQSKQDIISSEVQTSEIVTSENTISEVSSAATSETSAVSEVQSAAVTNSEATSVPSETTQSEQKSENEVDEDLTISASINISNMKAAKSASNTDQESVATNELRTSANSGLSVINITPSTSKQRSAVKNQEVYYTINSDGELSDGSLVEPRSSKNNLIKVYNNQIVEADTAIASTIGGYDSEFYIYESIENLENDVDGTSLNGGGFNAKYIETVEDNGQYYFHIEISGYDGYVSSDDVQLVPAELTSSISYFENVDGELIYYSALDSVSSEEYDVMDLGPASTEMEVGVKYYSSDDINYYTSPYEASQRAAVSYETYYMNLPFRSESSYTATDYKNYLKSKGYTGSEYYNETSAFTKAQSLESINSLMIFSMANHESAYGTSTYARACYNFFGRGAFDSDPDQACQKYNYNTPTDGVLAQTLFLQNGYFDILDWRYSGTHAGNKASGMNVKYASDTDWGKKIASHANMIDSYLGGKELNKYPILQVTGVKHVYTDSNLSTKVKSASDSEKLSFYDLSQMTGTSNTINVVAPVMSSNAYQIYVPTSVKQSSSSTCSYTASMRGSYPNYKGRSSRSVDTNTANYSCDYESFNKQLYWISTANTKLIAGPTPSPETYWTTSQTGSGYEKIEHSAIDGSVIQRQYFDKSDNLIQVNFYYSNGKLQQKNYYYTNGKWKQKNYYNTDGTIKRADYFNSTGKMTKRSYRDHGTLIQANYYDSNQKLKRADYFGSKGNMTKRSYYESGSLIQTNNYYSTGTLKQANYFDSKKRPTKRNYYREDGSLQQRNYYYTNGEWKQKNYYNTSAKLTKSLYYDTSGKLTNERHF
ncbi:glucosaminidase domain-containing protein [Mollicutes bacterium LVI A0078]|nr:glucosaminidase domain-containing protein [Mollicutes bacterium LVI A0075]WOO90809.1 glucosaminidase domain-containing protein [Mollicutes bacterium LVI A0078]